MVLKEIGQCQYFIKHDENLFLVADGCRLTLDLDVDGGEIEGTIASVEFDDEGMAVVNIDFEEEGDSFTTRYNEDRIFNPETNLPISVELITVTPIGVI